MDPPPQLSIPDPALRTLTSLIELLLGNLIPFTVKSSESGKLRFGQARVSNASGLPRRWP